MKKQIFAFDFDGTLTFKDSFVEFCMYACGKWRFLCGLARNLPFLLGMTFHLYPSSLAKERLFGTFFKGIALSDFDRLCVDFAESHAGIIKADGMSAVRTSCEKGTCVIISASVRNWIMPFFQGLPIVYLTTEAEVDSAERLTGKFLGANCKGNEKVRRLYECFPDRENYTLTAFGDSKGDKALLASADESHYRLFTGEKTPSAVTTLKEAARFCIVGLIAAGVQYACYRLCLSLFGRMNAAVFFVNSIAYTVSMCVNFVLSTLFTFRVKPSGARATGFLFSHAVNFSLQTILLHIFVFAGLSKRLAPFPTYALCVPVNFLLVRFFLKRKSKYKGRNYES